MLKILFKNIYSSQIIFKNTFWLILAHILPRIFKFFLIVYVAKILGPANYGNFQYIFSLLAFVYLFADLGINTIFIRDFQSKNEREKLIKIVALFNLILASLWLGVSLIVSLFLKISIKQVFIILTLFFFFQNIKIFFFAIFKALNKMELESLIIIGENFFITVLGIIFIKLSPSILNFALAYLLSEIIFFVISLVLTIKLTVKKIITNFKLDLDKKVAFSLIKNSLPFTLGSIVSYILTNTDILMIKFFSNEWFVGQYSISSKIVNFLFFIASAIASASFPLLARKKNDNNFSELISIFFNFLLIIGLPISIGGFILNERIIVGFFGSQYDFSRLSFKFLVIIIPFAYLTIFLNNIILIFNLQLKAFILNSLTAVLNVIGNFILIPYLSIAGAALTTLICQIINFLLFLNLVNKQTNFLKLISMNSLVKIFLLNVLNGLIALFLLKINLSTYLIVILSGFFYFLLLILMKEKTALKIVKNFKDLFSLENFSKYQQALTDFEKD